MHVLGLAGGFHPGSCDATAAVVSDGILVSAVEEERLTRSKHSFARPPARAIKASLDLAGLTIDDIDVATIYVDSYEAAADEMRDHITSLFGASPRIQMVNHHQAHAASTYYASGFEDAAIVNFDWSGDRVSTSIWHGRGGEMKLVEAIPRPNSLGIFYAAFTQFLGFERGDEYKVMGLSSYGRPTLDLTRFLDVSGEVYEVNPGIFDAKNRSLYQLVLGPALLARRPDLRRRPYDPVTREHKDLAASVQAVFETAVLNLVKRARRLTGSDRLCIAGGGGLNCRANGRIVAERHFEEVYLPPFPNDTGCAFGTAAVAAAAAGLRIAPVYDAQLGPGFSDDEIKEDLDLLKCPARYEDDVPQYVADRVCEQKLVAWHQGRMEVGPRALGGRSILADPRARDARERINKFVKFREDFRPFAPSVLVDDCPAWFDFQQSSPFMSFVADVKVPDELPAITHVDGSARVQTVADDGTPYAAMLRAMKERTGFSCVLNTSFNYMGQPVVCTPKEAIYTFFGTGLDVLAIGNWIVEKQSLA